MTDKIEKLANDEIAVIVWPYGAGQKQIGLCFDDEERPAAIFALPEERAFLLRDAIFGTALRAEVAALRQQLADEQAAHAKTCSNFDEFAETVTEETERLRQQLDEARADTERYRGWLLTANDAINAAEADRDRLRAELDEAREFAADWQNRLYRADADRDAAEADNARLLDVYRAAGEALVLLWALYRAWAKGCTVEPTTEQMDAGYIELLDRETSFAMDLAFSAALERGSEIEAAVDAYRAGAAAEAPDGERA